MIKKPQAATGSMEKLQQAVSSSDSIVTRVIDAGFTEIDELCASVRSWDLDFRPLQLSRYSGQVGHIVQLRVGPFEIGHARFRVPLNQRGTPPARCYTFGILETGMRELYWRGRHVDSETIIVFPQGSELTSLSGPDFNIHTFSLAETVIELLADRLGLKLPPPRARVDVFRPAPALLNKLRHALRGIRDQLTATPVAETVKVAESLVSAWLRPALTPNPPRVRERDRAIHRCLDALQSSNWDELSTGDLCALSEVSERTLQYAFRERFGLTPAAFMKAQRLAAAHAALAAANPAQSRIADIALHYGFWHVGQFAADYRGAFGELPSTTLAKPSSRRTFLTT